MNPISEENIGDLDLSQASESSAKKISLTKALFMTVRSLIGVGILTYPHQVQTYGILGSLVTLILLGSLVVGCLDLVLQSANAVGHYGPRLEKLVERVLGSKMAYTTMMINCIQLLCTALGNVIFSMTFFNYAICNID